MAGLSFWNNPSCYHCKETERVYPPKGRSFNVSSSHIGSAIVVLFCIIVTVLFLGLVSTDDEANLTSFSDNPLAAVYLKVREAARGKVAVDPAVDGVEKTCIMIDDASVLDIIAGGDHSFVLDFLQYCRALTVKKQRCSVVLLTHQDVYEEPPVSSMNLALEYAAATVLTVEPLSTGLSVDVHGQVTILHRTVQMEIQPLQSKLRSRIQKYQFRILEGTVQFFRPGQL